MPATSRRSAQLMRRWLYGEPGLVSRFASPDRQRAAIARAWVDYTAGSEKANDWVLLRINPRDEGPIGDHWLMI